MKLIHEAISLLNRGEQSEAMKCFRQYHNIVGRYRCDDCSHTADTIHNGICAMCSGEVSVVIILEQK